MHERVSEIYRRLIQRWNVRDADGFAALFIADGHAIGFDGSAMNGRAEIASTLTAVFQNERTGTYISRVLEIRELAPGVVLLRSVVGMIPPNTLDLNLDLDLTVSAVQSVVFVQQGQDVKIALLQSTPTSFHGRPEVAAALMAEIEAFLRSRDVKH